MELDGPAAAVPVFQEDEGPPSYDLNEPIGAPCPKCFAEMPFKAALCTRCGYNRLTKKKAKRKYTPMHRVWESDRKLADRLMWMGAAQGFHFFMGFVCYWIAGTIMPAIIMWPLMTGLTCFVLGTYDSIELKRDEKGRVELTIQWRTAFVPQEAQKIDVRGYEGVVSGPWQTIGFLEWFVFLSLLTWGIVPGLVWYYFAMHLPHYSVALAENHGQATVYVYRGRSAEQMNDIAEAICAAASIRRLP
jgi:ribosomal protein L40E